MFREKSKGENEEENVERHCQRMIVRIKKPEYVAGLKLSAQAQRVAVKNMINKQIKFVRSFGQVVSAVIVYDGNKEHLINLNLKK